MRGGGRPQPPPLSVSSDGIRQRPLPLLSVAAIVRRGRGRRGLVLRSLLAALLVWLDGRAYDDDLVEQVEPEGRALRDGEGRQQKPQRLRRQLAAGRGAARVGHIRLHVVVVERLVELFLVALVVLRIGLVGREGPADGQPQFVELPLYVVDPFGRLFELLVRALRRRCRRGRRCPRCRRGRRRRCRRRCRRGCRRSPRQRRFRVVLRRGHDRRAQLLVVREHLHDVDAVNVHQDREQEAERYQNPVGATLVPAGDSIHLVVVPGLDVRARLVEVAARLVNERDERALQVVGQNVGRHRRDGGAQEAYVLRHARD